MAADNEHPPVAQPSSWRPQRHLRHEIGSREQLERMNHGGGVAVEISCLPHKAIRLVFGGSQSATVSIWTTDSASGFVTKPTLEADLMTIRFVDTGVMTRTGRDGGENLVRFNQVLFTAFDRMRFATASPNFSSISATLSRDVFMAAFRTLHGTDTSLLPQTDEIVETETAGVAALRQTMFLLRDQMAATSDPADLMTPLLHDLLTYQVIAAWPSMHTVTTRGVRDAADRTVKLAIDYIEVNLTRRLEIAEIAGAAGLSGRALQLAFKKRLGCSPVQFMIDRRLDKVHSDLQARTGPTVGRIASSWGFVHMGDFGRRYRQRFGCTPGQSFRGGRPAGDQTARREP